MRQAMTVLVLLALGGLAAAPALPAADSCPLLVTVDDLPLAGGGLHPDPGERERIARRLLDALARHGIRAVGLVTWNNVGGEEDLGLLEQWLAAGHELGNHSQSHLDYNRTAIDDYIGDIEAARQRLAAFLEQRERRLRFFRFPMLHEGDTPEKLAAMRAYLTGSGQRNLPVTIDNSDYRFDRPWVEAERAGDRGAGERVAEEYHETLHVAVRHQCHQSRMLFGRDVPQILLLHANAVGAAQWDRLFRWLDDEGFRFATADEVLADPAFDEVHDYVGSRGPGFWDRLLDRDRRRKARRAVEALIREQTAAWNRGDLEAFVSGYHEDAVFVSSSGVTRGRGELLQRYRRRYPDRGAMGTLAIDILEIEPLAGTEISVLGDSRPGDVHGLSVVARWSLSGMAGTAGDGAPRAPEADGLTLLVVRQSSGSWKIVHDASF